MSTTPYLRLYIPARRTANAILLISRTSRLRLIVPSYCRRYFAGEWNASCVSWTNFSIGYQRVALAVLLLPSTRHKRPACNGFSRFAGERCRLIRAILHCVIDAWTCRESPRVVGRYFSRSCGNREAWNWGNRWDCRVVAMKLRLACRAEAIEWILLFTTWSYASQKELRKLEWNDFWWDFL